MPEDQYCKRHSKVIFAEKVEAMNKKMCANHIRGCRAILELEYIKSRCEACLAKDREKDKEKRDKAKIAEVITVELDGQMFEEKVCTTCCKSLPLAHYKSEKDENIITKTCKDCRADNKKNDSKRDKEHRNELARKNEKKPEIIETKKKWKAENYEKVTGYWMISRQRRINELGTEEYHKINAENAKKWRENNPDKVKENNQNKIISINDNYNIYKRSANDKNLVFDLSFEDYEDIIRNDCHYCGFLQNRGFNGIDRLDSKIGYTKENCVSSCKMCNYMKLSISENVFIKRVEHILTFIPLKI